MHPHSRRAALAAACFLATTSSGRAQLPAEPQWWSAPGTGIWAAGPVNVENARPLNVGQLKHVASQARTYLDNVLQPWGGAGTAITTLTTQFQGNSTNPLTPVAERAENAAPVNVGQLKQVAELFYDRLAEMGLDAGTETAARLGGTASLRPGKSYMVPWQNNLPATENNSIATIGQLKMAFGFEVDVDQDGVLDALEWYLINASSVDEAVSLADIDASAVMADADGDGLTAAQEFTAHTSWISPDTDNDGMLDGWELGNQLNPLADDAGEDSDLDQLTNVEEYQISWQTGQAFNPRSSHSFGPEWTDYEQSLLQTWGQSPAAVSAQRGSDQNALRSAPLYGQYRRGISYWIAQHLIGSGPQAPGSGWQPFVGTALRWLGKADEGDLQEDIQIAPSSGFADREVALPGWPEGLPESAFLYFGNGFSGMATASGGTTDVRDYAGQEIPENLIYSYENLGGKLDQLRVWLRLPQKVDFPVTRSFYVLKRTRYAATTPDMVELPSAVLDGLTLHTLTVPPAFQNGVPPLAEPTLPTGDPPVLLAAGSAGGGTNPMPASSESLPVDVAPTSDAVSKARVRHLSTAQPFRFVFRAYPQGLLQESGGAPVSAETEPIAYLPVRVNENREQTDGPAALGIEPTFEPMPDIDHNRASVASTGFLSGEALSYDRDFIKLEFDADNIPEDEISVEVHTSVASGTKLFLYDDEGRAIPQEELQATTLQPIAPIWGKLISGKVYAEIGRLNTAASSPVPGSPALPPAGAATITVEARFHNPQAPLDAGQAAAPTILSKAITLVPVELNTDTDNNGQINSSDMSAAQAAYASGATPAAIDKATEFIFANDSLSNGAWDKDDSTTPGKPATATDDDDAEEIQIKLTGLPDAAEVWLEHPAIAGLSFYTSRKCLPAEKVNLSPSQHYIVSSTNQISKLAKLYVRAGDPAGSITFPTSDPQVEGDLKLMLKLSSTATAIESVKMKFTVVREIRAKKYFQAVRDYIFENNTLLRIDDKKFPEGSTSPTSTIRICLMREEGTVMTPFESYWDDAYAGYLASNPPPGFGFEPQLFTSFGLGIDGALASDPQSTVVINGNQCDFTDPSLPDPRTWLGAKERLANLTALAALGESNLTDRGHGRVIINGVKNKTSSDLEDPTALAPGTTFRGSQLAGSDPVTSGSTDPGGKYVAQFADGHFEIGAGRVPWPAVPGTVPTTPLPRNAMGGLSSSYSSSDRDDYPNSFVGLMPLQETGKGIIFVAAGKGGDGDGKVKELYEAAKASGVPPISGATPSAGLAVIQLVMLDSGDTSTALIHKTPSGSDQTVYKGNKHDGFPYYTNTFLRFKAQKPRTGGQ